MHEHDTEVERAALWAQIAADNPEMDVDEALRVASAALAELLAFATDWNSTADAMRQHTTPPASIAYTPAQTA